MNKEWEKMNKNTLYMSFPSDLDVSRPLQVTGDLDVQWAVILWDFFVQINVSIFDHFKCAMMGEKRACTGKHRS